MRISHLWWCHSGSLERIHPNHTHLALLKTLLLLRFSNPKYPVSNLGIDYSWSCWMLVFSWLIGCYLLVDWLLPCWLIGCYLVGGCGSVWNSWCHLFGVPCTSCVTLDVNVKRKLWSCFTAAPPPFGLIELLLIGLLSFMLPLLTWLVIVVACLLLLTKRQVIQVKFWGITE